MRSLLITALVAALLVPATALAAVDVDLAFDPTEVCPGDEVQFFFSLENVGADETMVTVGFSFEYDGMIYGPFEMGPFPLAAGEVVAYESSFVVSPNAPPGSLTIFVEASDDDGVASDEATLTVLDCSGRGGMRKPMKDKTAKNVEKMLRKLDK